eukprot:CAMPEP_0171911460 /NCGR_PEP_ID=MMETSP0993-20121228/10291_1 /TAXON_ID=483369 /ORGANISM="non described non described, Strain CCMP2098" /LENGTH=278 /DNA_ID=CAMNT_0012544971 /DNA_START=146 /DNA_END=982 /DNA_ORIENTATION=-
MPPSLGKSRSPPPPDSLGRRLTRLPLTPEVKTPEINDEEHWLSRRPSQVTTARFLPRDLARENREIILKGCFEETIDFGILKGKSSRATCYRKHMLDLKRSLSTPCGTCEPMPCNAPQARAKPQPARSVSGPDLSKSHEAGCTLKQSPRARKPARPPPPTKDPYRRAAAVPAPTSGSSAVEVASSASSAAVSDEPLPDHPPCAEEAIKNRIPENPKQGESKAEQEYRMTRCSLRPTEKTTSPISNKEPAGGGPRKPAPASTSQKRSNLLKAMRLFGGR